MITISEAFRNAAKALEELGAALELMEIEDHDGREDPPAVETVAKWMKPHDVAGLLSVSLKTLANWRSKGTGPEFRKVGSLVRYDREAVEKWVNEQEFLYSSTEQEAG